MTAKDKIWLLAHSKHPEAKRAWAVLYWKYQRLTHRQIGKKVFKGKHWVQRYMTMIYKIFETPDIKDKDEKFQWLVDNVFPALKEFLEQYPDTVKELPAPEILEEVEGEVVEPPTQPNKVIVVPPTETHPPGCRRRQIIFAIPAILCLCVAPVLLYLGYRFIPSLIPQFPASPEVIPPNTATLSATSVLSPSPPSVSPVVPTEAQVIDTPIPTPEFYEQGQPAVLKSGVTVTLQPNFVDPNFPGCRSPKPGFAVKLLIHNTTGQQFLIRFDPRAFHAEDDTGNTYQLMGAGVNICDAVEVQNHPGKTDTALYLRFEGQIPLEAKYIIITADSLSGVKVIFHKPL